MQHPYEYAILVKYLAPSDPSKMPDLATEPAQIALVDALRKHANELPSVFKEIGEGWEVNSHSLALLGGTVVVSMLLQRHRK